MHTMERKIKSTVDNRRVSIYRSKSRDYFLEEVVFQVEGGVEYQAPE